MSALGATELEAATLVSALEATERDAATLVPSLGATERDAATLYRRWVQVNGTPDVPE